MKTLIFICLFCLYIPFSNSIHTEKVIFSHDQWKLASSDGNLKVYKRNKDGSSYKEIRIENIVNAKAEQVVAALRNADAYKDWIYKCRYSKKIKTLNDSEFVYHTIADLPMPLWDRDIVAHSTYRYDSAKDIHYFRSQKADGYIDDDENDKIVRVDDFYTAWKVKDLGDNRVSIVNQLHIEPGGSIPAWIVNMSVTKGPKKTMKGLLSIIGN